MSELVADVVAAVKSARAGRGNVGADREAPMPVELNEPYDLEMEDFRRVAERHFRKGRERGYSEGRELGREQGDMIGSGRQRREDVEVFVVAMGVVEDRLAELISAVAGEGESDSEESRTKKQIKQVALDKADEIRAGVVLLALKLAQEGI